MPKRMSTNWFKAKASQSTSAGMSRLSTLAQTGPTPKTETRNRLKDEEGNTFFLVGVSEIGGEEIV